VCCFRDEKTVTAASMAGQIRKMAMPFYWEEQVKVIVLLTQKGVIYLMAKC